jgi:hypothetical protein
MFFVSNLLSSSQAGRRGFESRLPLHLFNHFQEVLRRRSPIESVKHGQPSPVHSQLPCGASSGCVEDCEDTPPGDNVLIGNALEALTGLVSVACVARHSTAAQAQRSTVGYSA